MDFNNHNLSTCRSRIFVGGGTLRENICFLSIAEYDYEVYESQIFNVHR
jgi:hypothetical protein